MDTCKHKSPVPKKVTDRLLAKLYRPVSMTCIACKLLEHIVYSTNMALLDEHKFLSDKQHAFRKWHNCETKLTSVINDLANILDNQGLVDWISKNLLIHPT